MERDIVIVGAGHNGLVTAFYLARAGFTVEIVEARSIIGGACTTQELIPGYRFSPCAHWVGWWQPKVVEDMQLLQRGIEVAGTELQTRILPGNRPFVHWIDDARFQAEIARFSRADASAWPRWKQFWATAREIIGPYLLSYPPTLAELLERSRVLGAEDVFTTVLTTSLAELADRFFESDTMRGIFSAPP